MADRSITLVLEALGRAAAEPEGLPLIGGKAAPGLFPATPAGKQAAQRCKDDGLLSTIRTVPRGKSTVEICAASEKGLAFLLAQASPKRVLEDFIRALDARKAQISHLLDAGQRMQENLEALRAAGEKMFAQEANSTRPSVNGSPDWLGAIVAHLTQWQENGPPEDCTLPELYRQARAASHLTIGQFHDGLRKLYETRRIYLHPWTGPLHELPEPAYALLVGHEIAYYASIRK